MREREIRSRKTSVHAALVSLGLVAASAAGLGCASEVDQPVANTIRLELDFGAGVTLSSVNYVLTGPNGFNRTGTLAVGNQPTVTATFQNLPQGNGYDVLVNGTTSDGNSNCQGEQMFNVNGSMASVLMIPLTCPGQAAITGTLNVCPVIDELDAIPSEVVVGASIQLGAVAHDPDNGPTPLIVTWSTTGGMLSNQSATGATFTCTAAGSFTITVHASDGPAASTASSCIDTSSVTVTCTAVSAALEPRAPRRQKAV
jgi:hypothetical protein